MHNGKIYDFGRFRSENYMNSKPSRMSSAKVNPVRQPRRTTRNNRPKFTNSSNSNNNEYKQLVKSGADLEVGQCACYTKTIKICRGECDNGGNGGNGCTYTQGYWKNHEEAWPVDNLTLGSENYIISELLQILDEPVQGNGLVSLAHQLIAAKLNIANGADPTPIADAVASSDALIGALIIPPIGAGYLSPANTSNLVTLLDAYNNGLLGVPHCE